MDSLISRQAAIDALCSECQGRCIPCKYYPCSAVKAINALPSAQPEPDWTEIMVVCDNCGHIIHVKRVNVLPLGRAEGR